MSVTAWDGHVRVDYVPARSRLQVTVLTMEAVVEIEARHGLRTAFVTTDPTGPPSFIGVDLPDGRLPTDVRTLLGPRLAGIAADVVAEPPRERWARLDLSEISDLADGWAPYRARALAGVPAEADEEAPVRPAGWRTLVGSWAGDLWTSIGGEDLVAALRALRGSDPDIAFRGDPGPVLRHGGDSAAGVWELPAGLAAAAGVRPLVRWSAQEQGIGVVVILAAVPTGDPADVTLMVAFEDDGDSWSRFTPADDGLVAARITTTSDIDAVGGFRFRTANRAADEH